MPPIVAITSIKRGLKSLNSARFVIVEEYIISHVQFIISAKITIC